jgi:hypothetical protein
MVRRDHIEVTSAQGLAEEGSMSEQTSEFSGWAKVELMGRNVLIGYVTTRYFGPAALFQVDVPGVEAHEETLEEPEYVDGVWCPVGTVVARPEIPSESPMVGPTTIYRLTACTEEVAKRALKNRRPRAIAVVKMPDGYVKRLDSPNDYPQDDEGNYQGEDEDET